MTERTTDLDKDTFSFTVEEKIGLPGYSNIVIRASITRNIEDDEDARQDVIDTVEAITAAERSKVLEELGVETK